jgi:hypothetical protein
MCMFNSKKPETPKAPPPPVDTSDANDPAAVAAADRMRKSAALAKARSNTLYTSPLGAAGSASVKSPTLG